jgi:hypothetical protein
MRQYDNWSFEVSCTNSILTLLPMC